MNFDQELKKGKLLKRYKRFFADIDCEGETLTAHLPNTGSLKSVPLSETECWFSEHNNPKRKLKYTLEYIECPEGKAGVNTSNPNKLVGEALSAGLYQKDFPFFQAEVKISDKTRVDFVLYKGSEAQKLKYPKFFELEDYKFHFLEVKNVSYLKDSTALFPDGVTARGAKHLEELMQLINQGHSAEVLFCVQREGAKEVAIAEELDPHYAQLAKEAKKKGLKFSAYPALMDKKKVLLDWKNPLKVKI